MAVIWVAIKGILIGLGMIMVIKVFGWDKKDDDE
tara:strand:+ start:2672 stop:2773 length:102 start_codon:yes stop_codon:yes gene_type:complete